MITIEVESYNAHPVSTPIRAEFGDAGGTIGRGSDNTLVLLDPDRKISRTHAMLTRGADGFVLRDQGSVVPVMLNGQPLGNGREAPLRDGDEIRIGGYVMSVQASAATAPAALVPDTAAPLPDAPALAPETAIAPNVVPETAGASAPADAAEEPVATSMTSPVLSWDNAEAAAPDTHVATVILAAAPHAADAPPPEPDVAENEPATAASPPPQPAPETLMASTAAATAPASQPAAPVAAPASNDELLRALLVGAGLSNVEIPGGLTPERMRQIGQILREATRGLLDLLAARANTKREVRANMTVIVASDNNPLKFSPGMEAALSHLLVPRGRGFMSPQRAVDDAYEDLRAHQLGFMAGMRSALTVVLGRFDPKELEHRLSQSTVADSLLPTHRKAKLWDLFGQHYAGISKEAESDLHSLFAEEFLKTYQAHARSPGSGSGGRTSTSR